MDRRKGKKRGRPLWFFTHPHASTTCTPVAERSCHGKGTIPKRLVSEAERSRGRKEKSRWSPSSATTVRSRAPAAQATKKKRNKIKTRNLFYVVANDERVHKWLATKALWQLNGERTVSQQTVQKLWRISTNNERPLLHATLAWDRIDTEVGHRSSLRVKTINL